MIFKKEQVEECQVEDWRGAINVMRMALALEGLFSDA